MVFTGPRAGNISISAGQSPVRRRLLTAPLAPHEAARSSASVTRMSRPPTGQTSVAGSQSCTSCSPERRPGSSSGARAAGSVASISSAAADPRGAMPLAGVKGLVIASRLLRRRFLGRRQATSMLQNEVLFDLARKFLLQRAVPGDATDEAGARLPGAIRQEVRRGGQGRARHHLEQGVENAPPSFFGPSSATSVPLVGSAKTPFAFHGENLWWSVAGCQLTTRVSVRRESALQRPSRSPCLLIIRVNN